MKPIASTPSPALPKPAARRPACDTAPAPADPKTIQAAREFEAIFLRKVLSSLQKTTHVGGDGAVSSGGEMYGSMMVNSLSDAVAAAGGIGLSDLIVRAMASPAHAPSADGAKLKSPAQVCDPSAVPPEHKMP